MNSSGIARNTAVSWMSPYQLSDRSPERTPGLHTNSGKQHHRKDYNTSQASISLAIVEIELSEVKQAILCEASELRSKMPMLLGTSVLEKQTNFRLRSAADKTVTIDRWEDRKAQTHLCTLSHPSSTFRHFFD
jgi:hypothetical protein